MTGCRCTCSSHSDADKKGNQGNFPYFAIKLYVVTPHLNQLAEVVLLRGHTYIFVEKLGQFFNENVSQNHQ